jgi:hypothetical protein
MGERRSSYSDQVLVSDVTTPSPPENEMGELNALFRECCKKLDSGNNDIEVEAFIGEWFQT